ncbi:MAG: hypothetical protein WC285_03555, partial [Candidatus Gracilibacteria bacterium]
MKRFSSLTIGIFIGISASCVMIYLDQRPIAFGEEGVSTWENFQAWNEENLSWRSVFSSLATPGKDLYKFVGSNLVVKPKKEATKVIAQKYHLTEQEADKAINGSITVLFNNTATPEKMTTEQAYKMQKDIMNDYDSFSELFDIQQEIDTAVSPTEMFSNGDLQDSGFDLIYDLDVIERILFTDVTEVTLGRPLTEDEGNLKSFMDALPVSPNVKAVPSPSGSSRVTITDTAAEIQIGDQSLALDISPQDICPTDNVLDNTLNTFDEQNPPDPDGGGPGHSGGGGAGSRASAGSESDTSDEEVPPLAPAESGDWRSKFCGEFSGSPTAPELVSLGGEMGPAEW